MIVPRKNNIPAGAPLSCLPGLPSARRRRCTSRRRRWCQHHEDDVRSPTQCGRRPDGSERRKNEVGSERPARHGLPSYGDAHRGEAGGNHRDDEDHAAPAMPPPSLANRESHQSGGEGSDAHRDVNARDKKAARLPPQESNARSPPDRVAARSALSPLHVVHTADEEPSAHCHHSACEERDPGERLEPSGGHRCVSHPA